MERVKGLEGGSAPAKAQRALESRAQGLSCRPRRMCLQVLRVYAGLSGVAKARCESMLELTGLTEAARMRTGKLSGGMRQRLGLALLLLADAPVLLLDEPGLSLDPAWRKRPQATLHFEAQRGKTVLVTAHLISVCNTADHSLLLFPPVVIQPGLRSPATHTTFAAPESPQPLAKHSLDEHLHVAVN